jgi:hypothetical protein
MVLLDGQQKLFDLLCEYHSDALCWQYRIMASRFSCSRNSNWLVFVGLLMMPCREPDCLTSVLFTCCRKSDVLLLVHPFADAEIPLSLMPGWNILALEALIVCYGGVRNLIGCYYSVSAESLKRGNDQKNNQMNGLP